MTTITIATRVSDLALWQAYHIKDRVEAQYPEVEVILNKIVSNGDKVLDKPLALIGGKGHFTKELEDEMLAGNADMAVHSLKDVPTYIPEGLELVSVTQRQDQSDVLLSHKYSSLENLPKGAVVGTTSLRRRMQLLQKRPDLQVKDLRGNVNTRLRKLAEGQYDAIILAYIGLFRLDLLKDIPFTQKLSLDMMIPPMGQAALGIEIVQGKDKLLEIAEFLKDEDTFICTQIERDFISSIGAGCSAPVACNAVKNADKITFRVMLGFADGTNVMQETIVIDVKDSQGLGITIAKKMIDNGALELLKNAETEAFKEQMPQRL